MATAPKPPTSERKTPPLVSSDPKNIVPVTADSFMRAESVMYFGESIKLSGRIGKLYHYREVMPVEKQTVIRANRNTDMDRLPASGILIVMGPALGSNTAVEYNEKIHASLATACPQCSALIEPEEQKRVDGEHMECPWCGERFIPGRNKQNS